jgi:hypothetical protein
MASTRDYDLEKKRWRWTYHLFRGVVAVCVLYVAGTQIIERAARSASPAPAPPPMVEPPPSPPVVEAPPPPPAPPPVAEAPPAPPPPPQVVDAPPRPTYRVPGQSINGRAGPGTDFRVVRRITNDLVLVATGEAQNDWLEVFVRGGAEDQKFWVYRNLVRAETP